ncbi:Sec-independent protein translocase TatB [Pseudolysinimonas yzui]|uniref:Sec-independent protein translocase TatB n=1 Tax=Pseudolysinimonas yzui TaxID=2708254 RepID=A0A8J3DYT0_9MICO|nr:Sec-independent protein translocase TatB [Pseudolysinimonas yzui]GHF05304.1 hypothetical protein GCM10011600_02240 [Pseudolysinimonas yzui]
MNFGLTMDKVLIIGVIAVFLIGPDRLPLAAAQLARFVRAVRSFTDTAKERVRDEVGPEFDEVDWAKLDPRRYDPRRIVRDALQDDAPAAPVRARPAPTKYGPGSKLAPSSTHGDSASSSSPGSDAPPTI